MSASTFTTLVLCPVCRTPMDTISHAVAKPLAEIHAGISDDVRKKHAERSPDCAKNPLWLDGWILTTKPEANVVVARTPMSVNCVDCGAPLPAREQEEYNTCHACRIKNIHRPNGKTLCPADMPNPILPKKPEDEDRFVTAVLCPVCGVEIDRITHPQEELNSMVAPLVSGNRRRKHGKENPACAQHPNWIHGWTLKPIKRPEADPPKPEPTCAKCGKNIQQHPSEQIHRDAAGRPICYLCVLANAKDGECIPAPTCLKCGRPMMRSRNDPVNGMLWYCDRCYNAQTRPVNPTGWECPRCKGIHAPWVLRCECKHDYDPICPVCKKSHPPRSPGGFPTCYPIQL